MGLNLNPFRWQNDHSMRPSCWKTVRLKIKYRTLECRMVERMKKIFLLFLIWHLFFMKVQLFLMNIFIFFLRIHLGTVFYSLMDTNYMLEMVILCKRFNIEYKRFSKLKFTSDSRYAFARKKKLTDTNVNNHQQHFYLPIK